MPKSDSDTQFIRIRRDVHARLGVAIALTGNKAEQCDVASDLLTSAMDARGTPHPEVNKPVAKAASKLIKKALSKAHAS